MRRHLACMALLLGFSATGPAQQPSLGNVKVRKLVGGMSFIEGPVWFPEGCFLVFSDIPQSKLMKWSAEGGLEVYRDSENSNGNLLDLEGRLLTCQHGARNLVRTSADGEVTVLADQYGGKRLNSPNDVAVQSDGTLWFTDPPWGLPNQREGRELEGIASAMAQAEFCAPRVRDWQKLAPDLPLRPEAGVRTFVLAREFSAPAVLAAGALGEPRIALVRFYSGEEPGTLHLQLVTQPARRVDQPRRARSGFRFGLTDADLGLTAEERAEFV